MPLNLFWTSPHFYLKKSQAPSELLHVKSICFFSVTTLLTTWYSYKRTYGKVYSNSLRYSITLLNGSSALDAGYISAWFEVPFWSVSVLITKFGDVQLISLSTQQIRNNAKPTFDQTRWRKSYQFLPCRTEVLERGYFFRITRTATSWFLWSWK